jgi:hypothetical protein
VVGCAVTSARSSTRVGPPPFLPASIFGKVDLNHAVLIGRRGRRTARQHGAVAVVDGELHQAWIGAEGIQLKGLTEPDAHHRERDSGRGCRSRCAGAGDSSKPGRALPICTKSTGARI